MDHGMLHRHLNVFLYISDADKQLLAKMQRILTQAANDFTEVFNRHIPLYPEAGGELRAPMDTGLEQHSQAQLTHLLQLVQPGTADTLTPPPRPQPTWLLSSYRLFMDHLSGVILTHPDIDQADRQPLINTLFKLLFRDMGMHLENHWQTATRLLLEEKRHSEYLQQQITDLLSNIPQVLWSIDVASGKPIYLSPGLNGIAATNIELPIPCLAWTIPEDREMVERAWQQAITGESAEVESRIFGADNTLRWFRRTFHPYRNEQGNVVRIDGFMEEITDYRLTLNRLESLATTDALTGLPNRVLYHDRLTSALTHAARDGDYSVVVMLLDLNHFKYINDALGHQVGDTILQQVASRLSQILRKGDTLARLGGDEFALLLPSVTDPIAASQNVAEKIQDCFASPYYHMEHELHLGVSIGIAHYPEHGDTPDTLIRCADLAMYHSKRHKLPFQHYETAIERPNTQRIQIDNILRRALKEHRFELHYQPKLDIASKQPISFEALLRLPMPNHELLHPNDFIGIAEQIGLMDDITEWVLHQALAQGQQLTTIDKPLTISVNVSPSSFKNKRFLEMVRQALASSHFPAARLEIEITENALMSDLEQGKRILRSLSDMGVSISIDDFGTGYSSLAYLKQLPIDQIKVDKSFIIDMQNNPSDTKIVRSIIDLGHNLGYQVVAEGVENQQTLSALLDLGCDAAQGYHISHPLLSSDCNEWLRDFSTH